MRALGIVMYLLKISLSSSLLGRNKIFGSSRKQNNSELSNFSLVYCNENSPNYFLK